ncbi:MAG: hypothetical protein AVDCRST_MAG95-3629 [uncultured Adhaeribacter sp.]|uniref:Uncharacterized protein n=1 Tax=uncultured Adhaeribacter sp. TaxID=448109 RepID=A0A6J4JRZ1_9BACT|nr:MAG: hypothetical protein AVDCRST_MAG95-3629 [uncultured Adhaeribacter sp.]
MPGHCRISVLLLSNANNSGPNQSQPNDIYYLRVSGAGQTSTHRLILKH